LISAKSAGLLYENIERRKELNGSEQFSDLALYRAYEKRLTQLEILNKNRKKCTKKFSSHEIDKSQHNKDDTLEKDIDIMVAELEQQIAKREKFSRRRKDRLGKNIESINDRNASYNRKLCRAFETYTREIKNNLVRGSARPD
jgi:hypothetical protein